MTPGLESALAVTQSPAPKAPLPTANVEAAKKAAKQYEGIFVSEFLGQMFEGISTDGPFGGGQGEQMFRSLMLDQYGKQITSHGGFGLSDAITKQLLKTQESGQ